MHNFIIKLNKFDYQIYRKWLAFCLLKIINKKLEMHFWHLKNLILKYKKNQFWLISGE